MKISRFLSKKKHFFFFHRQKVYITSIGRIKGRFFDIKFCKKKDIKRKNKKRCLILSNLKTLFTTKSQGWAFWSKIFQSSRLSYKGVGLIFNGGGGRNAPPEHFQENFLEIFVFTLNPIAPRCQRTPPPPRFCSPPFPPLRWK